MAKGEQNYEAADRLRDDLAAKGVSVDDKARTWSCTDGRSGSFGRDAGGGGGRKGPTISAAFATSVDRHGTVDKHAAAAAANAAARGWNRTNAKPTGYADHLKRKQLTMAADAAAPPAAPMGGGGGSSLRAEKDARAAKRMRADPLDPASAGYAPGMDVPVPGKSTAAPGERQPSAAALSSKALPTPGEILRMNQN